MIAFCEKQQPTRGFKIERLAPAGERADHDSAGGGQCLLSGPQAFLALGCADEDEAAGIEAELSKTWRVRRAVFGEDAILTRPDHAGLPGPHSCEA